MNRFLREECEKQLRIVVDSGAKWVGINVAGDLSWPRHWVQPKKIRRTSVGTQFVFDGAEAYSWLVDLDTHRLERRIGNSWGKFLDKWGRS